MKGLAYGAPVAASVKDTNKGKNNEAAPMIPARATYASEKSLWKIGSFHKCRVA